jgi:ABC-2 type transport system permease protein
MRYAFLVAWREFAENAKTKGFWIGILVFPVLLYASISVPRLLEKTKPVRNFVLVDQSGDLEDAVERALDRLHQKSVLAEFANYVKQNAKPSTQELKVDLEKTPAVDVKGLAEKWASDNPETLEEFLKNGGLTFALAQIKGMLKDDAPAFEEPKRSFREVELPDGIRADLPPSELAEVLKPYLRGERSIEVEGQSAGLFAAVIVPSDILERTIRPGGLPALPGTEKLGIQYWSSNLADDDLKDEIERSINEEVRKNEYEDAGVDQAKVLAIQRTYLPMASLNPKKEAGEEAVSVADQIRQWAPVGFVYLLWIAIFTIQQMLLNNTIEEKSNRIIEVLLSSVTPGELMMGKLIGIAAVGLTMIGSWILFLFVILKSKAGPEAKIVNELLGVLQHSGLIYSFVVYFVLGYLLYAGAFLAIGSLCNTLKEAQNLMQPVMVIMMVPLLTMMFIPKDPNGTLATALSWIPPYTPFIMLNRAAADPPLFERVGTLVLLIVSTIGVLALSGRIFRLGILRTGQPPKFLELLRWVRSN